MGNMSYCMFENTYYDLLDCYDCWDNDKTITEKKYQDKIVDLCEQILNLIKGNTITKLKG